MAYPASDLGDTQRDLFRVQVWLSWREAFLYFGKNFSVAAMAIDGVSRRVFRGDVHYRVTVAIY